jgi:hypothetical protein
VTAPLPPGLRALVRAELARRPHATAVVRFLDGDVAVVDRDALTRELRELEHGAWYALRSATVPEGHVLGVVGLRTVLLDGETLAPVPITDGGHVAFVYADDTEVSQ